MKPRKDPSMSGKNSLLKVRYPLITFDHERGKVGWAHWRTRKKQATAQYRRRILDKVVIQDQFTG